MDYGLNDEQRILAESLKELIQTQFPDSYFKDCDKNHRYPVEYKKALVDNGFSLLGVDEKYGGIPSDTTTLMLVAEVCARCGAPYYLWGEAIQIDDILTFGNEEQKKKVMEIAMAGHQPFALGFSEPSAGSDNASVAMTATYRDGKYYLNGTKTLISFLDDAPYILALTRDLNNPNKHKAITMWLVPVDSPGITVSPFEKIGWHMTTTSEVTFDDVEVKPTDMVGVENNGFLQLMKNFEIERILSCACMLGAAELAYDDAIEYAKQREQFGKKIGDFQLIQEKLTDMAIAIENMRNFVYKAAWKKDNGESLQSFSALCKRYCAEASWMVVDQALQIYGGVGYVEDVRIARLWRDIRVARIGAGTSEIMVHIAGRVLQKEHKPF